ncbi:MAG: ABC transporter permease [Ardenticatenaceae bacterium]|nr:ABC transporter permease [Ardenticatenaceae bacterium]
MTSYIVRRFLGFIPVLFGVALVTFVMIRQIPGGPFDFVGDRTLPPQVVANIEARYHLDWPIWKQFLSYLVGDDILGEEGDSKGILRGDFGLSLQFRSQSVSDIIKTTMPISMQLGLMALILALLIGIPAGTIAALRQNTWVDYISTFSAIFFVSVPSLVLAPVLIWLFALKLGWLPVASWGAKPPFMLGFLPSFSELNVDYFKHAIMPVFALGSAGAATVARLTRASLLQVIREDYIRTARAKGLREKSVITIHALKNGLIPVVTILGPAFATLITGTFVIEQIFGINGMGKHFVTSVSNRDYTLLLGVTLLYSTILVAANLLVDLTYALIDPRIRFD